MVDVSKVKSRLGSLPESGAVKGNPRLPEEMPEITDGRSLRATGRTAQLFNTGQGGDAPSASSAGSKGSNHHGGGH
jgi:hypothetical protein